VSSASRGRETRERLLEVAEKEFARYGYAGAHLQSIAEQIGVQKTALYYYFDSKGALWTAVVQAMLEAFERVLADALSRPGTHRERLERLAADFNDLLAARPHYARILIRIFSEGAGVDAEAVAPTIQRVIGRVLTFYREGVDAGAFARRSARHFFQSFFGAIVFHYAAPEFSARVLEVDDIAAPEVVRWRREEVLAFVLRGVLPDDGSEGGGPDEG
jgi:AcrR family transcriptional regulator